MDKPHTHRYIFSFICLIYIGWALPLIPEGTDDLRLAGVFSIDEYVAGTEVFRLYENGITQKPSFKYGALFYYVPVLVLKLLPVDVSQQVVLIVLRMTCLGAGVACLWLTYSLGRHIFHAVTGLAAAGLLATLPVFLRWSIESHPDLPQLFWMLCALTLCCATRRSNFIRNILLSALCAGLAFGTKYGGIFLIPVILGFVVLYQEPKKQITVKILYIGCVAVVFIGAFVFTNMYAVLDWDGFVAQVASEKAIMDFGHSEETVAGLWPWAKLVMSTLGYAHVFAFGGCVICLCLNTSKANWMKEHALLIGWIILYLIYLVIEVHTLYSRHMLIVLPLMLIYAAEGYRLLVLRMPKKWLLPNGYGLLVLLCVTSLSNFQAAGNVFAAKWNRASKSIEIQAGKWLGDSFEKSTSIVGDAYSYIPPRFTQVYLTPIQSYPIVQHFEPDVLVVREASAHRYDDVADASRSRMGEDTFLDVHFFYQYLKSNYFSEYQKVKGFGTIQIYQRQEPRLTTYTTRNATFAHRIQDLHAGQMWHLISSRERMGDIAFSLENWSEAVRNYELLIAFAPKYVSGRYKLGRTYLRLGELKKGDEAFERALNEIGDLPPMEWANVHADVAQSYFTCSFYAEAAEYFKKAISYNGDLAVAHFDLAACLLAQGQTNSAENHYNVALSRFGPHASAISRLNLLREKKIQVDGVDLILSRYFSGGINGQ